jgi:small subunit ribosomal protein S15
MTFTPEDKKNTVQEFQRDASDTGSPEVQIALLSKRIENLSIHLRTFKGDLASRRGLLKMVGQRRRHLRYLSRHNRPVFDEITAKLGIRVRGY